MTEKPWDDQIKLAAARHVVSNVMIQPAPEVKPSEYDAVVPLDKMPPCPICGKPIIVPPQTAEDRLMVFIAHGRAALGHDGCKVLAK